MPQLFKGARYFTEQSSLLDEQVSNCPAQPCPCLQRFRECGITNINLRRGRLISLGMPPEHLKRNPPIHPAGPLPHLSLEYLLARHPPLAFLVVVAKCPANIETYLRLVDGNVFGEGEGRGRDGHLTKLSYLRYTVWAGM